MQDAPVRKMYRQVRRTLGMTSAIKVVLGSGLQQDIPKSDERIYSVGMSDRCELYVIVLQEPDTFRVTINFPGSIGSKTINITEVLYVTTCIYKYTCMRVLYQHRINLLLTFIRKLKLWLLWTTKQLMPKNCQIYDSFLVKFW